MKTIKTSKFYVGPRAETYSKRRCANTIIFQFLFWFILFFKVSINIFLVCSYTRLIIPKLMLISDFLLNALNTYLHLEIKALL